MPLIVGNRYYRITEDEDLEILKLKSTEVDEENMLLLKRSNTYVRLSKEDLEKDYILLTPDAYVSFSIIDIFNDNKDVMVVLYDKDKLKLPYLVCRQNIFDLFTNQFAYDSDVVYVGLSISRDTCPNDIPFESLMKCNKELSTELVSVYVDDTIGSVLQLINTTKYNEVLKDLYCKFPPYIEGANKTLMDLFKHTDFIHDFHDALGVLDINIKFELTPEVIKYISDLLVEGISNPVSTVYSKLIDLSKIERKYKIIKDIRNNFYILVYDKSVYQNI